MKEHGLEDYRKVKITNSTGLIKGMSTGKRMLNSDYIEMPGQQQED
jgi:hypothetical protein